MLDWTFSKVNLSLIVLWATSASPCGPLSNPRYSVDAEAARRVRGVLLAPESPYELTVAFDIAQSNSNISFVEQLDIQTENEPPLVDFNVGVITRDIKFTTRPQKSITVKSQAGSGGPVIFSFKSPQTPGLYELFVEISQKNRLIQVVRVPAVVSGH
jgi:hypothetical protein